MNEQQIIDIIVPMIWIIIPITAILLFFRIRTNYKIEQLKVEKKIKKGEETISGSINKLLTDAPNNLKQINSEIATIEEKCRREHIPEAKQKELLSRLNSEKDMLTFATRYGDTVKPFLKPIDKIANRLLGSWANG